MTLYSIEWVSLKSLHAGGWSVVTSSLCMVVLFCDQHIDLAPLDPPLNCGHSWEAVSVCKVVLMQAVGCIIVWGGPVEWHFGGVETVLY